MFSNRFFHYFPKHYDLNSFDGVVVSSDVKMIKPNPEIYQYILKTYHLNPEESLFVDDMKENIEAAKALGIHGIVFETYEQAVRDLNELI